VGTRAEPDLMIKTDDAMIAPPRGRRPASTAVATATGPPAEDEAQAPEIVIRPQSGWIGIDWKELFAYRELLFYLVWRDIAVRYKQTALGPAWAVLQPLLLMLIFTFFFGRVARFEDEIKCPYPVFVFAGLIPWTLFSQGMAQSALSLVNQQNLLTKVYFPRLLVPVGAACVFLVDVVISLGIYALVLLYYRVAPSWTIIVLPVLVLLTLIATLSIGVMIAALTVFYRDFRHIVPFLTQIFMFLTPVIYPAKMLSRHSQWLLALNPMFGTIKAYHSAILGWEWDFPILATSAATGLGLFLLAVLYFRRMERRFADFA
jgi:lipopolysaccharide transport system permease protein